MGPQQSYRSLVVALMAFVAFAFLAALLYVPGASRPSEASADTKARGQSKAASSFTLFESGQVRPLALSPDRQHLFAVNTPDNRLEVFRIKPNRLIPIASIPGGRQPVAGAGAT